ncbi:MAG: hypothetical protein M1827_000851 [Pycnora praestabilis]|nr:MAG: hypothetical protein M1827_000851 [Pycnora praestabilis]
MASVEVVLPSDPMKSILEPTSTLQSSISNQMVQFDPARHLAFAPPAKIHMMRDIGYPEDIGVSPVAVSEPFSLFSQEAIKLMRAEVLSDAVKEHCTYSSDIAACQLRGFAPKFARFVYDAWKSPKTLAIISKIAGVDLVPEIDFEIAHVNLSVKTERQKEEELAVFKEKELWAADEGIAGCPFEDDKPIVDWHHDSYPFVCVLMLSDCTSMIGGETALKTGSGDILKVRGPQMGCAVVLQGRYIEHQALRALGATERITMVTSFRPRCPMQKDDTVLTTVRPISNLSELYYQFSEYRLEIMEERIRAQLNDLRARRRGLKQVDTKALKQFFAQQEAFMAHTNKELVEEENVVKGEIGKGAVFAHNSDGTVDMRSVKRARSE